MSIEKLPLERLLKTAEYLQELSLELDDFLEEKIDKTPEEQLQIITEKHLQLVTLTDGKQRDLKTMVSPLDIQFSYIAVELFTKYVKGIKGNIRVHKRPLKEMVTALFGPSDSMTVYSGQINFASFPLVDKRISISLNPQTEPAIFSGSFRRFATNQTRYLYRQAIERKRKYYYTSRPYEALQYLSKSFPLHEISKFFIQYNGSEYDDIKGNLKDILDYKADNKFKVKTTGEVTYDEFTKEGKPILKIFYKGGLYYRILKIRTYQYDKNGTLIKSIDTTINDDDSRKTITKEYENGKKKKKTTEILRSDYKLLDSKTEIFQYEKEETSTHITHQEITPPIPEEHKDDISPHESIKEHPSVSTAPPPSIQTAPVATPPLTYTAEEQQKTMYAAHEDIIQKYKGQSREFQKFSDDLLSAIKATEFLPEEKAFDVFLQIAKQESDFVWNPRIDYSKKGIAGNKKKNMKKYLDLLKSFQTGYTWRLVRQTLTKKESQTLEKHRKQLEKLYKTPSTKEYEVYAWAQDFLVFLATIKENHPTITSFAKKIATASSAILGIDGLGNIEEKEEKLARTPNSFGIFQVNVDFFIERIKERGVLRKFSEISSLSEKELRHQIVLAFTGVKSPDGKRLSVLSMQRTLELIIEGHLKPRYENHNRGEDDDIKFMAIENLSGEMSTYRAAIQQKLNIILHLAPPLITDGDLFIAGSHTTKVDMKATEKRGKTYAALKRLIKASRYSKYSETDIQELFNADSWKKLQNSVLYKAIMGKDFGKRILPDLGRKKYRGVYKKAMEGTL